MMVMMTVTYSTKLNAVYCTGFPRLLESSGFFTENSRTWKVMENNNFGPGKSRKLKPKILESPGEISLKVVHFYTLLLQ